MSQHDTGSGAGPGVSRSVRLEPTVPGFWPLTLGVCIAALAPLFGFLAGVMMGRPADDARFGPLYWGLFIGIVLGGLGVVLAVLGGVRLRRHLRDAAPTEDTQDGGDGELDEAAAGVGTGASGAAGPSDPPRTPGVAS